MLKYFRKGWESNKDGCLDKAMLDITANPHKFDKSAQEEAPAVVDEKEEIPEWV